MTAVAISPLFNLPTTPYVNSEEPSCLDDISDAAPVLFPLSANKSTLFDIPVPPAPLKPAEPLIVESPRSDHTLSLAALLEAPELSCTSVHKLWGNICLKAVSRKVYADVQAATDIDFVVVIDHSSSMRLSSKLAYVKATIEYFISQLGEAHRFCLVKFNQDVNLVTDGLIQMTPDNKSSVLDLLHNDIRAEGSTNISDALFTALGILKRRHESEHGRLSCIMLFTDGLANAGLRGKGFMQSFQSMPLPQGLTIHTFGYGVDHDSKMLQDISYCSKGGVYHFIETTDSIAKTFGECLAGLLATVAHNVEVRLSGRDGCRLVNFYTKYPIAELQPVKEYNVSLGSLYSQESRTILFKLSLRKLAAPIAVHELVDIVVRYTNTLSGRDVELKMTLTVGRPEHAPSLPMPLELDVQINRYMAAAALEEAICKASCRDFTGARKQLSEVVDSIKKSASYAEERQLALDLVDDLEECALGMVTAATFNCGVHYALAYAGMYFMERSTGSSHLIGVHQLLCRERIAQQLASALADTVDASSEPSVKRRHGGYGYVTYDQEALSSQAGREANGYVTGYLEGVL